VRVAEVLAPVRDAHHLPGLIGAILAEGRIAAIGSLGIRKIGSPEPIRIDDKVHLGSCTKAMTATLLGSLVDEGRLSWRSTIGEVFPDLAGRLDSQFQEATVSQLLTHRAGLPQDAPWWQLAGETTTEQRRALLPMMLERPPQNKPGTRYSYSNLGYILAGLIAEETTGLRWESLMRQRLFEPLEMTSAGFGSVAHAGKVDQPWGHHQVGEQIEPTLEDNPPVFGPAGTVHCSVPDWARFAALHLDGARGKAGLLKPATFRALHTPPRGADYAGGWLVCERSWAEGRALTHSGSNRAWYVTIWLAPARNFATLVATNQGDDHAKDACDLASSELIKSLDYLTSGARKAF
jgi:CubicO group peptidase (beta-lactamase class C family)